MWISGLILIGVVAAMALNLKTVPLHTAAVTGAILCVVTGCLKEKEAYAGIDWVTISSLPACSLWLRLWKKPGPASSLLIP